MGDAVVKEIDAAFLKKLLEEDRVLLIDVREEEEYRAEHIPGSVWMPLSSFNPKAIENEKGQTLVFQCRSGGRSAEACKRWMACRSGDVFNLKGGIIAWKKLVETA